MRRVPASHGGGYVLFSSSTIGTDGEVAVAPGGRKLSLCTALHSSISDQIC